MDYYYNLYKLNENNNDDKLLYFFKFWEDKKDLIYVLSKDNQDILTNTIMKYDDLSKQDAKVKCLIIIMFIKLWYEAYPKHNYYFMTEIIKKLFTNYKEYI